MLYLETDKRFQGIGEATGGLNTQPIVAEINEIKHLLLGKDPRKIHEIYQNLFLLTYLNISKALAGIETACWDILAQTLKVPLYSLLGGKIRDQVRVYANGVVLRR